jgi:cytochrome P450
MEPVAGARHCPFDYAEALEFDPVLRHLMTEEPVSRIRLPHGDGEAWLVTGYDDVRTVTTDRRFSRTAIIGRNFPRMTPEPIVQDEAINVMDPPGSSRLRSLISKGFAPRHLERMRVRTQHVVDELLDRMEEHGAPADLFEHLAAPLPLTTICEVLDIPEDDRAQLRAHARTMMDTTVENKPAAVRAKADLRSYFETLTAERRANPGDDLMSGLTQAMVDGELLSDTEIIANIILLFLAGQSTTRSLISNAVVELFRHPDQLALLRADPSLDRPASEEFLRFVGTIQMITKRALGPVTIDGVEFQEGDQAMIVLASANRDPEAYAEPERMDITRFAKGSQPPIASFGFGLHYCLGANLARMEVTAIVPPLVRRFPDLQMPDQELTYPGYSNRGPNHVRLLTH